MLFSRDWLGQYVELPDDAAELARRLTAAGLAVEHTRPSDDGADVLLDIDVTTNRPDCMNHFGLAREVAVLLDRPLLPPRFAIEESADPAEAVTAAATVTVEDPAGCPRYVARVIRGVVIGDSPAWLRKRLEAIGLRSINNVVDVTNFVLWELGQPLHAFDLAKLAGRQLVVRRARSSGRSAERLVTLDGVERVLTPEMLVIADAERPVGLAGVMGGLDSEVTAATVDILLESAHFDRRAVRRAARGLGLHTDASHRFERGADPEACLIAADRAAALLAELAGGQVLDRCHRRALRPAAAPPRPARPRALDAFAGTAIPAADVERWLGGLGFAPRRVGRGQRSRGSQESPASPGAPAWDVTVPSWRFYDFEPRPWVPASRPTPPPPGEVFAADLYEEVLRMHGFDPIPATLPALARRTPARARARRGASACATTWRPAASSRRSTSPSRTRRPTPPSPACGRRRARSGSPTRSPSATRCCAARWCRTWSRAPASTSAAGPRRCSCSRSRRCSTRTLTQSYRNDRRLSLRQQSCRSSPSTSAWSAAARWGRRGTTRWSSTSSISRACWRASPRPSG